ncbi:MAG TPA: hypothetical protein VFT27_00750 [Actinomycetota bacterium]|nr:hypothetical protein [Actinomycetota bacterium]
MKTTGRLVVLAVALVLALTACTGGDEPIGGSSGASGGTAGTGATAPSGPTGTISVRPGSSVYRYVNAGLQAVLDLDADTLEIRNETGSGLAKPGFYVLDARDGSQVDGQVRDPAGIPTGETATFDVALDGIELRNIGLVVLLVGPDNLGAFVPQ